MTFLTTYPLTMTRYNPRQPFRVAHINVRSIRARLAELEMFVRQHRLDVVAVQETWLSERDIVTAPGYYWMGCCRSWGSRGGTGFLISESVVVRRREDLERVDLEATWIEIVSGGGSHRGW